MSSPDKASNWHRYALESGQRLLYAAKSVRISRVVVKGLSENTAPTSSLPQQRSFRLLLIARGAKIATNALAATHKCVGSERTPLEKSAIGVCHPDYFSAQAHRRFRRWAVCLESPTFHPASRVQSASCSLRVAAARLLQVVSLPQILVVQKAGFPMTSEVGSDRLTSVSRE